MTDLHKTIAALTEQTQEQGLLLTELLAGMVTAHRLVLMALIDTHPDRPKLAEALMDQMDRTGDLPPSAQIDALPSEMQLFLAHATRKP